MVKNYSFINLFRALAAAWVLLEHCMIWGNWHGVPLPAAKIAVDLFMVISGFLMASNGSARWHVEPLDNSRNWLRFLTRRYFRLAPAYYVSLALAVVAAVPFLAGYRHLQLLNPEHWPDGGTYDPRLVQYGLTNLLLHLSFVFGVSPTYSFTTFLPDWSLSLEMQFYVAFPFLFLLARRFRYFRIGLGLGVPVFIAGYLLARYVPWREPSLLLFKLNYFLAGMVLFDALSHASDRSGKRKFVVLALCALFLTGMDLRYRWQVLVMPTLMLAMIVMGRLELFERSPAWLVRLTSSRWLNFASDCSYGVYLFHGFFISASGLLLAGSETLQALSPAQRVLAMFAFVGTGAYATAFLVHRFVETPGIRWGAQLMQRRLPAGGIDRKGLPT